MMERLDRPALKVALLDLALSGQLSNDGQSNNVAHADDSWEDSVDNDDAIDSGAEPKNDTETVHLGNKHGRSINDEVFMASDEQIGDSGSNKSKRPVNNLVH